MTRKMWSGLALAGVSALALVALGPARVNADMRPDGAGMGQAMMLHRFDEIDADKDGKVTAAEMAAFRSARFAAADADGNGSLSADELIAVREQDRAAREAVRAQRMLVRLDADGDGLISAEEFTARGQQGKGFARADADGDGAVSKAEAQALMRKMADHAGGKHGKHGKGQGFWGQDDN